MKKKEENKKSRFRKGDTVKIIKKPIEQSKYSDCLGFDNEIGKITMVEENSNGHIFLEKFGGCYQVEQLKKLKIDLKTLTLKQQ